MLKQNARIAIIPSVNIHLNATYNIVNSIGIYYVVVKDPDITELSYQILI